MAYKTKTVLHYPRLDTVLTIEAAIKNAKEYPSKAALWKSLPKKIMYQTFCLILDYLERSNKIIITKDNRIVWIFVDNRKLEKLLNESVKFNS